MAALTRGKGCTVFVENIFESRYRHVDELSRMGADIRVEGRVAVVYGVPRLHGAQVRATDLRGGAALAVAALGAEGRSELTGVHHIDRGYQSLEGRSPPPGRRDPADLRVFLGYVHKSATFLWDTDRNQNRQESSWNGGEKEQTGTAAESGALQRAL